MIAPSGTAFEVVHEERHELWLRLFHVDDFHLSPSGSLLDAADSAPSWTRRPSSTRAEEAPPRRAPRAPPAGWDPADFAYRVVDGSRAAPLSDYVNDLEPPAFECEPVLAEIKARLLDKYGFHAAMMSGSGTSLFAVATGNEVDAAAWPAAFVDECKNELDVDVDVWPTRFLGRDAGEGYAK